MTRLLALSIMVVALGAGLASRLVGHVSPHSGQHSSPPATQAMRVATAKQSWHFAAVPHAGSPIRLLLFNPNPHTVHVWLRLVRQGLVHLEHVSLAPQSTPQLNLTSRAGKEATGTLTIQADGAIVPERLVAGQIPFGSGGLGRRNPNDVPIPARSWSFPALPRSDVAVVLTIFNPNMAGVDVSVHTAGRYRVHWRVHIAGGSSRDLALSSHATAALIVDAAGAIVPQRTVLGARGTATSYGKSHTDST